MTRALRILVTVLAATLVVPWMAAPSTAIAAAHGGPSHRRAGIPVDRLRQPQFVSRTQGYALVFHGDSGRAGVAVTLDGGRRWTPVQHPPLKPGSGRLISASRLSLAVTGRRLLVWGPPGLLARRLGRSRWHRPIATRVGQVAVVGSSIWATTWPCDVGTRCPGWLQVSRDFGRTWRRRAPLPRGVGPRNSVPRLVRDTRRTAYLVRPDLGRNGALAVTTDGGRSWSARPLPHRTEHEFTGFRPLAVGSDGGLWLAVPGEPSAGSESKAVYRSLDGGRSWTPVAVSSPPRALRHGNVSSAGYVSGIRAVGSGSAYLLLSRALPLRTSDGGLRWRNTFEEGGKVPGGDYSSVSIDTLGQRRAWLWLVLARHLWATRDGGRAWSPVASYPIRHELPRCTSDQLRVWLRASGSNMSQPYARIGLQNVGTSACAVRGYPRIAAWGGPIGSDQSEQLAIDVQRGAFMEARDRGPRRIGLRPGSRAVFSVGTGTAYSAHLMEIQSLTLTLPGVVGSLHVPLRVYATAPPGKRIPVFLTAVDWRIR
jgi:photosystem II stability/assembly factor-like uncharacterized protein